MADTQVLGTCVFGRAGSSPASRTCVMSSDIEDKCRQFGFSRSLQQPRETSPMESSNQVFAEDVH
jgi:hypothetical protein